MISESLFWYVVAGSAIYATITLLIIVMAWPAIYKHMKLMFLRGKGYGIVRINGPDRVQHEHVVKLRSIENGLLQIHNHRYYLDTEALRFTQQRLPLYEFNEKTMEPVNVTTPDSQGTDASFMDSLLFKLKSMASKMSQREMQYILYASLGALIVAGICAGLAYTNYNEIQRVIEVCT